MFPGPPGDAPRPGSPSAHRNDPPKGCTAHGHTPSGGGGRSAEGDDGGGCWGQSLSERVGENKGSDLSARVSKQGGRSV